MSQSQAQNDPRTNHFEQLLNRAKPKSRYIAQSHIDEQIGSIAKEIVNGDINVRQTRGNLDLPKEQNDFEEMIRKRYLEQFSKEKEELQHRLGYIENSMVHLGRFQYLKRRAGSIEGSRTRKSEEWRKEHEEEMKKLENKKKQIAEKMKAKEAETEELRNKIQEEQKAKHKAQVLESIKKVKERTQKRNQSAREQKQKLKQLLSRKQLYQKLQEQYNQKQKSILQQRKKKLAQIRQLKPHISMQQIIEHEQRVLQMMKEKQAMRTRQARMNSSRARAYRPSYQSAFYKQILQPPEEQFEDNPKQRIQKMRQFSEQVKTKYVPDIDQRKRKQMEERYEKQTKSRVLKEERDQELLEKPKLKGLEYLQLVKRMPKKRTESPPSGPKTNRIAYKNYLGSVSVDMSRTKPWNTLLTKGDNKAETAQLLQFESEKLQEKLKRKEEYDRVMKIKDDGMIDQEYYEMVKAKLSLLGKE